MRMVIDQEQFVNELGFPPLGFFLGHQQEKGTRDSQPIKGCLGEQKMWPLPMTPSLTPPQSLFCSRGLLWLGLLGLRLEDSPSLSTSSSTSPSSASTFCAPNHVPLDTQQPPGASLPSGSPLSVPSSHTVIWGSGVWGPGRSCAFTGLASGQRMKVRRKDREE